MNLQPIVLLPTWVSAFILMCAIALPTTIWHGFRRAGTDARIEGAGTTSIWLAVGLFLWVAAAISLSLQGFFEASPSVLVLRIAYALFPLLVGVVLWSASRSFRDTLVALSQPWLIQNQLYRALGSVYLISWCYGLLPGVFAIPAGVGDVLVAISAPFVASLVRRRGSLAAPVARLWSIFGLLDIVVGVTLGFLTSPSPLQQLAKESPNILITTFPMVLIPTIILPLLILCYLYSFRVGTALKISTKGSTVDLEGRALVHTGNIQLTSKSRYHDAN